MESCVQWVLSRENVFLNSVGDIGPLFRWGTQAADNFESRPPDETMKKIDSTIDLHQFLEFKAHKKSYK